MNIIQLLLDAISPTLRKLIVDFILSLSKAAAKTDNPLDDILVGILISVFVVPTKNGKSK
ncbi:hypothetical protein ES703_50380 [subsurface metagenome]